MVENKNAEALLRIRLGLAAGVLAPIVFFVGEFFLQDQELLQDPSANPTAFAAMVTSSDFAIWAGRGLVGVGLEVLGAAALYLCLFRSPAEPLAFFGLLFTVLGDLAGAAMFGLLFFALPGIGRLAQQTGPDALHAATGAGGLIAANALFTIVGLALFAVAIWRSGQLPRWSGVAILVGFLLIPIPVLAAQLASSLLWGAGALWLLIAAWNGVGVPQLDSQSTAKAATESR